MIKNEGYTSWYKADMRDLFQLLLNREKNAVEVHKLFGRMFNCIWYRRKLAEAETPEGESLARWSMQEADNELRELMSAWCLFEGDKNLIWSVVYRTV